MKLFRGFPELVNELSHYEPPTTDVHPEPVLIVPSWITKYCILTVFMIS